ncbi:MSLNL protein, partial [Ptilonorhynchus violaceus]|nr:MSLNL protein [Ptilonorhynchus violaceus]
AQLSCLARLLAAKNLTGDFSSFPPDLLLFFDPSEVRAETCREFYARASRGNLDLLPRGSSRRTRLLRGALSCLGVRGRRLEPPQLLSLGALVCDTEPGTIPASHPAVLENLKLCPALTGAQQDALNALLLTGHTKYGDPSSWDLHTLQDLGPLVLALNQTTLGLVAEAAREDFRRSIAAAYSSQGHSQREKSLILLRAFAAASASSHPRLKRSSDRCESEPITASSIADPLLLLNYNTEQFDLCLSNEVLIENLEALVDLSLPTQYLQVLKEKLDRIFPSGIPEEQLKRLGPVSRLYTGEEISRWSVASNTTLAALLSPSGGEWEDSQVQQLLSRYLALGGSLTGPLLQEIGGRRLCNLREEQIQQIPAEAVGTAGQLNISSCSQDKKEQLYRKAREAFASLAGTPAKYYCRIWPYLGGAPAEDLKHLANAGVAIDMDLDTFLALNPEELQKLSVTDVKNLLGENLPELKKAENEPAVRSWVKRQSQRELDCVLGIGLQGGLEEPTGTPTPPQPPTSASATSTATTSPAVTLLTTLLATSSPSAASPSSVPLPAVTSRATTSAGVGTNPAGATHSTSTPVPSPTSAPAATLNTNTPLPNPSSAPAATHSTVSSVPHST